MKYAIVLLLAATTLPPLPKTGNCPSNYTTSGDYCLPIPGSKAQPAVPKTGNCPSGFTTSGGYCVKIEK